MLKIIIDEIKTSLLLLLAFTLLTGLIYPAIVTALAQLLFPWQANGSIIIDNNKAVGSQLIGQYFTDDKYFWGRPSATVPIPYNSSSSSGSNLGPSNPTFLTSVENRIKFIRSANPKASTFIPIDLVTASGSGLDPHISPLAAFYQIPRVAHARNISEVELNRLVQSHIITDSVNLGEPRINVLQLNMTLDHLRKDDNARTTS